MCSNAEQYKPENVETMSKKWTCSGLAMAKGCFCK